MRIATTKIYHKCTKVSLFSGDIAFYPKVKVNAANRMYIDWLNDLNIPDNAQGISLELHSTPIRDSVPVSVTRISYYDDEEFVLTRKNMGDSCIFSNEFQKKDIKRIRHFINPNEKKEMYLLVYYYK